MLIYRGISVKGDEESDEMAFSYVRNALRYMAIEVCRRGGGCFGCSVVIWRGIIVLRYLNYSIAIMRICSSFGSALRLRLFSFDVVASVMV